MFGPWTITSADHGSILGLVIWFSQNLSTLYNIVASSIISLGSGYILCPFDLLHSLLGESVHTRPDATLLLQVLLASGLGPI